MVWVVWFVFCESRDSTSLSRQWVLIVVWDMCSQVKSVLITAGDVFTLYKIFQFVKLIQIQSE